MWQRWLQNGKLNGRNWDAFPFHHKAKSWRNPMIDIGPGALTANLDSTPKKPVAGARGVSEHKF